MKIKIAALFLMFFGLTAHAQNNTHIDVQRYQFDISLSDLTDIIYGKATIDLKFLANTSFFYLDLGSIDTSGKGMTVSTVSSGRSQVNFKHSNGRIRIQLPNPVRKGEARTFVVTYSGIPADGLIIGKSIFGKRTFFGDNWPNRAHYWLPCNDIPADKAAVEFMVTAPQHFSVVSNGIKIEERLLNASLKFTHWKEDVPLPTKVMIIGAADFAVSEPVYAGNIPVTSWVYEEQKDKGFKDYGPAKDILQYYIDYIGPYPYKKLANVQSKTIFGGMENAGAIFYYEKSVTGDGGLEDLLAHEIVHQWFGDMVTESDFKHLWLSEGFATYLTNVYIESKYGTDSMNRRLEEQRFAVNAFASNSSMPVVDTTSNYMRLLNANSYQKGGWILHMLRNTVGDAAFKNIIREHYRNFAGKNSSSADFIRTAEIISQKHLEVFFNQWLYKPETPVLATTWNYNERKKNVVITVEQKQAALFTFPLELKVRTEKGDIIKTMTVKKRKTSITVAVKGSVSEIVTDPNYKLLWKPAAM